MFATLLTYTNAKSMPVLIFANLGGSFQTGTSRSLAVKMTGPDTAEVGREAKFLIDVTNNGPTPIANITATDTFDPGLAHSAGERSPLVRPIRLLAPGQTAVYSIDALVKPTDSSR